MSEQDRYPRFLRLRLEESLLDSPVVLIHKRVRAGSAISAQPTDDPGVSDLAGEDVFVREAASVA